MSAPGTKGNKPRLIPPGSWLTIAFVAGVSLLLWSSFAISHASAWVPQWVLAITLVVLLLELTGELLPPRQGEESTRMRTAPGQRKRMMSAAAWLSLLMLLAWMLGVAPGGALFCFAWLRWHAGERWPLVLTMAAGLGLVLWLLFTVLLGVGLYTGVLWPYLN